MPTMKEINLVEYPTVEDCLKQVVCKHHIPEIIINNDHSFSGENFAENITYLRSKIMIIAKIVVKILKIRPARKI